MFGLEIGTFPLIVMHIVWLGLIIFLISLVNRLVKAVEKIAGKS